ncbi:terminase small subunit [Mucilaginibacter phyllosphaerae]|uniref:Uncharacterized protein n=1 Tax=Mucilaginibacter phyllosphaerae TaxID=1812349 RepID=A0A4Y8AKP7_9SPHI|nr:terminase small subunit [Mucilaginibacter phyllosphaerae]MBB3967749.1 hypothetical protein [Mucilaginibacter phyllosphaerae]TEW69202.1 hypothetical protein E2R65_03275 [Mucilaginibacter phyllosphaerae]GGH03597.1 hypothetical protein GCM10007352_06330 [Mucilaginibacter phyllosphaerae]
MKQLKTIKAFRARIARYFSAIQGEYHIEKVPARNAKDKTDLIDQKVWDREPEPATLSGLALALGFTSISELEAYERDGKFAKLAKKARLKVEAEYEKKLHYQSSTGAIFFLKNLGWNEKADDFLKELPKTVTIEIIDSGPGLASNEKDVRID